MSSKKIPWDRHMIQIIGVLFIFLIFIIGIVSYTENLAGEAGKNEKTAQILRGSRILLKNGFQWSGNSIDTLKESSLLDEISPVDVYEHEKGSEGYIVIFKGKKSTAVQQQFYVSEMKNLLSKNLNRDFKEKYFSKSINGVFLDITKDEAVKIKDLSFVKKVHKSKKVRAFLSESAPQINADDIWVLKDDSGNRINGRGVKIAIIDTGVDYTHPDLGGCFGLKCKVMGGYDFVNNDKNPLDDNGHGTHVASIAAGNGVVKGIAPSARIYAYKVLRHDGWGNDEDVISAIEMSMDPNNDGDTSDHLDVISMSLGGYGDPDDTMSEAVDNAVDAGIVVVVAAGNGGPYAKTISSPGTARGAITVGAVDKSGVLAEFSSRGPVIWKNSSGQKNYLIKPDVVAPGVLICAARYDSVGQYRKCIDNRHIKLSGTSMATPHVAGLAALLKQKNPAFTPEEIKSVIKNSAREISDIIFNDQGFGLVDALTAISVDQPCVSRINAEKTGAVVFTLSGSASCRGLGNYKLSYKRYDSEWQSNPSEIISEGEVNLRHDILLEFDTTGVDNGPILIELEISNSRGSIFRDKDIIEVDNFRIISIGENLNYIKNTANVYGKIDISSYSAYRVEYKKNAAWEQLCFVNSTHLSGAQLCEIDASNITDGPHDFRLSLLSGDKWISSASFRAAVIHELVDGWPQEQNGYLAGSYESSGVIETFDNAKKFYVWNEFFDNKSDPWRFHSVLYTYSANGSAETRTELKKDRTTLSVPEIPPAIIGYGYGGERLIGLQGRNVWGGWEGASSAGLIDYNGNYKYDWPVAITNDSLDGIFFPMSFMNNTAHNVMFVFNSGQDYIIRYTPEGKQYPLIKINRKYTGDIYCLCAISPVSYLTKGKENRVAIVDTDGYMDTSYNNYIKVFADVFKHNGSLVKRTYLFDGTKSSTMPVYLWTLSADVNNDGNLEMIVAYSYVDIGLFKKNYRNPKAYKSFIWVVNADGNLISTIGPVEGYVFSSVAAGNFGRTYPEIAALLEPTWATEKEGSRIILTDYKGSKLLDQHIAKGKRADEMLIGDVDGDNEQEMVVLYEPLQMDINSGDSGVLVINKQGMIEKEIPVPSFVYRENLYDPILSDFDQDGKTDLLVHVFHSEPHELNPYKICSAFSCSTTRFFVFNLGGEYAGSRMDWPMEMHDNHRSNTLMPS